MPRSKSGFTRMGNKFRHMPKALGALAAWRWLLAALAALSIGQAAWAQSAPTLIDFENTPSLAQQNPGCPITAASITVASVATFSGGRTNGTFSAGLATFNSYGTPPNGYWTASSAEMAAEAAIVGPPACDSFTGSSSTVTINIAAAYNAIEVSFALFNGLAPTGVTNNSGNETYTVTAYNGATPIASQTLSLLGDPFSGIATGSYGLVDLVAPAGQTMTRVTITPALSYGANIWNYLIDSIAFNQSVQNALGAGADTDTTTLTLSPNPATIGQNVTASVSVAATAGATVPTGNVVISGGGATCTATLSQSRGITATGTALGSCTLVFATPGDYTVTADYAGDASFAPSSGTADIKVVGLVPVITTAPGARAGGAVNAPYTLGLTATNSPTQWDITAGQLPPGLTMNPASGAISGTPNAAGSYDFTVTASNAAGASAPVSFTISIAAAGAPSATPVPTLGETALALLAALLGVSAAFTRGRGRGR